MTKYIYNVLEFQRKHVKLYQPDSALSLVTSR